MFLINLIPMHVLVLMVTGRFSHRIYVAYSTVRLNHIHLDSHSYDYCMVKPDPNYKAIVVLCII